MTALPSQPLLAFYGDDFTGSTDAMEVLATHHLDTLLFLRVPTSAEIDAARERFAAVGIAGISRAKNVPWMDTHLPAVYDALQRVGAAICHYKVCSTFDSSPTVGNIGHALQLGRAAFDMQTAVPIVVGAPRMRRYTFFGQLFAAAGTDTFRIDRHPTMSVHPVTPMDEADLRVHLSRQAPLRIGLMDIATQQRPDCPQKLTQELAGNDAVLFDVMDAASQVRVGEMVWSMAQGQAGSLFCVGSSGLEYALVSHWSQLWPQTVRAIAPTAPPVERIIVMSGSCSPVTAGQIRSACADGFADIRIDTPALLDEASRAAEFARLRGAASEALVRGESPLIYSACGPDDPAIQKLQIFIHERNLDPRATLALLGRLQGELLRQLLDSSDVRRVVIAGGDTSGEVMQALDLVALQLKACLFPGAPLCQGYTALDAEPVVEIALKGGQMGDTDYFQTARRGCP